MEIVQYQLNSQNTSPILQDCSRAVSTDFIRNAGRHIQRNAGRSLGPRSNTIILRDSHPTA